MHSLFYWQIGTKNLTKREFIVEPSFFTSWTIRSEKCARAHVQQNKTIYLSIWKPFLKRVYIYYKNSLAFYNFVICLMFLSSLNKVTWLDLACEQALLFGRVKRVSRERASKRGSREGQGKGELATISHKISFVLRLDEGKYHWLNNDVPEIKVDW